MARPLWVRLSAAALGRPNQTRYDGILVFGSIACHLKRLWRIALAVMLATGARTAEAAPPQTGRTWVQGELITAFSPSWSATAWGDFRWEYSRNAGGPEKGLYMVNFWVGPDYTWHVSDDFTLKASLWYRYSGFPNRLTHTYNYQHNVEVIPAAELRIGRWSICDRLMFHNTVYASRYPTDALRAGLGTVLRQMLQVRWAASKAVGIFLADELFIGIKEDAEATPDNGPGYWENGLRVNRVYAGFDFKLTSAFSVRPKYVFETIFTRNGSVGEHEHYVFLTLSYLLQLYETRSEW